MKIWTELVIKVAREYRKKKNTIVAHISDAYMKGFMSKVFTSIWVRDYLFLINYVTLEGAVSNHVLCYQQLFIARYQVSCFAEQLFWVVTNIVHSAFDLQLRTLNSCVSQNKTKHSESERTNTLSLDMIHWHMVSADV